MTADDADAVAAIEDASFAMPWSRDEFWRETFNEFAVYLVAVGKDGTLLGYGGVWLIADEAQLLTLAVSPPHRRRGAGARLLDALIRTATERGAVAMTLEVRPSNAAARALYHSRGFRDCGRRPHYYIDNGEDAIIMWSSELGK